MDSDAGHILMGDKSKLTYVIPQTKQWQCSGRSARDLDASISRVRLSHTAGDGCDSSEATLGHKEPVSLVLEFTRPGRLNRVVYLNFEP